MANIIQQFKNANGDNIFPLAYAQGGMKMDLLWTNPSPNSSFSPQTISLDLSNYDLVFITAKREGANNDSANVYSSSLFIVGESLSPQMLLMAEKTASYFCRRWVTVSSSGVEFTTAYTSYNGSSDNNIVIPQKIYGIKMSYIVPTSVHGLQYVEV